MESSCVTQREIVNEKLRVLRKQKKDMIKCLNKVLKKGKEFGKVDGKGTQSGFEKMCRLIESTSELVANICSQVKENPQDVKDPTLTQERSPGETELKEMSGKSNRTAGDVDKRISDLEQTVHDLIKMQSDNTTCDCCRMKKRQADEDDQKTDDDLICKLQIDVENLQREMKELTKDLEYWQSLENTKRNTSLQQIEIQNKQLSVLCDKEAMLKDLYENLSRKVSDNSETISAISVEQKNERIMQHGLEREMEDIQRNFEMVLEKYEQNITDVGTKEMKPEESSACVLSLSENTRSKQWIGFAAKLSGDVYLNKNQMTFVKQGNILNFSVIFNKGFSFDPALSKFTARKSGIYLICLTMHQYNDGQVVLHITKRPGKCQQSGYTSVYFHKNCVLEISTNKDLGKDCLFSFIELKDGDSLYVKAAVVAGEPLLTDRTVFSCFLLS